MKKVHKETSEVGTRLVVIECRMIAQEASVTAYSPDWPRVTCKKCRARVGGGQVKREKPIHKREGVVLGYEEDRIAIECSLFSVRATLPNSDDWTKVTCKRCKLKMPKTLK